MTYRSSNELEYRGWRFQESELLIPREVQWKNYFDNKFADIDINTEEIRQVMDEALQEDLDPKFAEVHEHIDQAKDNINDNVSTVVEEAKVEIENNVEEDITEAKEEILEKFEDIDIETVVNAAKVEIEEKIEEAKDHLCCDICCAKNQIIEHIDEKLSDLNQQVIDDGD